MDIFFKRKHPLIPGHRVFFPKRPASKKDEKELFNKKINIANKCAKYLYSNGAKRVWLFGSLAQGENIDHLTDIDLAVEGLKKPNLSRVRSYIRDKYKIKIDVVCLETANPGFRREIMKKRVFIGK